MIVLSQGMVFEWIRLYFGEINILNGVPAMLELWAVPGPQQPGVPNIWFSTLRTVLNVTSSRWTRQVYDYTKNGKRLAHLAKKRHPMYYPQRNCGTMNSWGRVHFLNIAHPPFEVQSMPQRHCQILIESFQIQASACSLVWVEYLFFRTPWLGITMHSHQSRHKGTWGFAKPIRVICGSFFCSFSVSESFLASSGHSHPHHDTHLKGHG